MPGKVPDRWEDYTPFQSPVKGTRFIAFKVPLEQGICSLLPQEQWFTPEKLIKDLEEKNHRLGLVIDLTNTKRYYKPSEIEVHGVGFIKINTEGRVVPSKAVQEKFMTIVDDFLERNVSNDLLIGVHCTHGLNRTGYMVCRYMIDRMRFVPKEAIEAFNEARGYSMERENYITDLMNSDRDEPLPVDNTSDGEIVEDEDSESGVTAFETKPPANAESAPSDGPVKPLMMGSLMSQHVQPATFRGRGFQKRGFQNYPMGQRGFQRRPYNNRGFQNNYNRGRGGFQQNFQGQGGYVHKEGGMGMGMRGRGDFRGRGGFRGRWNNDQRGMGRGAYNPYDAEELDEDTEVIITKSERGTIIREERSSSHAQKIREADMMRPNKYRKPYHEEDERGFTGRSSAHVAHQHQAPDFPPGSWERPGSPPRKHHAYKEDMDQGWHNNRARSGYAGSFDNERHSDSRGRGNFRDRQESFTHRRSFEDKQRGYGDNYGHSEVEQSYPRQRREPSPPPAFSRERSWSPENHNFRHGESQRFHSTGADTMVRSRGEGRGFGRGDARSHVGREEGRGYQERGPIVEHGAPPERRQYPGRGQERSFETHSESRGFRGAGRGESRTFVSRGRGRDTSPVYRDVEERPNFRPRTEPYNDDVPRFEKKERPPAFHRQHDSPEFHERPVAFRPRSRSPSFRKKASVSSKYSRENSPSGFDSDISEDSLKDQFEDPGFQAADRGRRGAFRGRVAQKQLSRHSQEFSEEPPSPPRARTRRMTPPAQYRDREPSPPPFKRERRERSPAFRDDSPEPTYRDDNLKNRGESNFRGRGHDGFRGRGRGEGQKFRGAGPFQKMRGAAFK